MLDNVTVGWEADWESQQKAGKERKDRKTAAGIGKTCWYTPASVSAGKSRNWRDSCGPMCWQIWLHGKEVLKYIINYNCFSLKFHFRFCGRRERIL